MKTHVLLKRLKLFVSGTVMLTWRLKATEVLVEGNRSYRTVLLSWTHRQDGEYDLKNVACNFIS
jgi:hypothetical protein